MSTRRTLASHSSRWLVRRRSPTPSTAAARAAMTNIVLGLRWSRVRNTAVATKALQWAAMVALDECLCLGYDCQPPATPEEQAQHDRVMRGKEDPHVKRN